MALRVALSDLWPNAQPDRTFVVRALRETTDVELTDARHAELLLFSVFGRKHSSFVGTKVQFSGENTRPRWGETDYAIGCNHLDDPRFLRMPFYAVAIVSHEWLSPPLEPGPPWRDRDFCLLLTSHPTERRAAVFDALSQYRFVTSAGSFRRNVEVPELEPRFGQWRPSKLQYLRNFRFTIAFEHSSAPGYTTEKLVDPLIAGSIPIYWGNPRVAEDVHPECFIDASDFPDLDALVEHVRAVDRDEDLARSYLARRDYLVKPVEEYWDELVAFLGAAAASVGTRPRAAEWNRAVRLTATSAPTRAYRSVKRRALDRIRRS